MRHRAVFRGTYLWKVLSRCHQNHYAVKRIVHVYPEQEYVLTIDTSTKQAVIEDLGTLIAPYFEWEELEDLFL